MIEDSRIHLNDIVKESISPMLKGYGFRKNGLTWNRNRSEMTDVLNLQISKGSNEQSVEFTINCGLFCPPVWEIVWATPVPKRVKEDHCFPRGRINSFLSSCDKMPLDLWWTVKSASCGRDISQEVRKTIEGVYLPKTELLNTIDNIWSFVEPMKFRFPIDTLYKASIAGLLEGEHSARKHLLAIEGNPHWAQRVDLLMQNLHQASTTK